MQACREPHITLPICVVPAPLPQHKHLLRSLRLFDPLLQNINRKPNCRLLAALLCPLSRIILPKFVDVGVSVGSPEKTGVLSALNISKRNWALMPSRMRVVLIADAS